MLESLLFENYSLSSSMLSPETSVSVLMRLWLIVMKMRLKMRNGSHRYDIDRTKPRYRHKYTIYKICLSMMMIMCNKQHLSNIWR